MNNIDWILITLSIMPHVDNKTCFHFSREAIPQKWNFTFAIAYKKGKVFQYIHSGMRHSNQ